MRFRETGLEGAYIVDLDTFDDTRGFFARAYAVDEFEKRGLEPTGVQCNVSYNRRAGTLRGMHYQVAPATEAKFVRCIRGAVHDAIVDLRPGSPTFLAHVGVELTADNRTALYVPPDFAHGYQALTDGAEVFYQVSAPYSPDHERGLRYDDPLLGIRWPLPVADLSPKDASWPLLSRERVTPVRGDGV
ncbi:MAG: dTDP-4-dehydrorhamnose 3,5-epimerase [Nitriliruptorales bacterium]|nr:dTDP-4-dehydrorhamnose 3,5-epimerase [Nitriliruptorales bacterium]